jgi:hypothetical protein
LLSQARRTAANGQPNTAVAVVKFRHLGDR